MVALVLDVASAVWINTNSGLADSFRGGVSQLLRWLQVMIAGCSACCFGFRIRAKIDRLGLNGRFLSSSHIAHPVIHEFVYIHWPRSTFAVMTGPR